MINQQCYTVKELIQYLGKYHDQNDTIIFDYLTEGDIRKSILESNFPINKEKLNINKVMSLLDENFDFAIGNCYANEGAIDNMLFEISDDIGRVI
jgi:hypothetical protein